MKRLTLVVVLGGLVSACTTTRPVPAHGDSPATKDPRALKAEGRKQLPQDISPKEFPRIPDPEPAAAQVPAGYRVEVVIRDLVYPTSVEIDEQGNVLVAEAGYAYGDLMAPARVHRFGVDGSVELIADQLNGPVNDILWHQGKIYVAHRGKISVIDSPMKVRDLVTGLPSFGDHHTNSLAIGPDGKLYFGQGTATNAGVVGLDNVYPYLWAAFYADVHDIPPQDLELNDVTYTTPDPITVLANSGELVRFSQAAKHLVSPSEPLLVKTGAFAAFGRSETRVKGDVKANGTILRVGLDGTGLEVYAWGLRNPFGVGFKDAQLIVTDLGFDERGSRPIANAPDVIWAVKQGAFYGFPDFAAGRPVTEDAFKSNRGEAPKLLLKNPPPVEKPMVTLPPHTSPAKFDFSRGSRFGAAGQMFLAQLGWAGPVTGSSEPISKHVSVMDLKTGKATPFFTLKPERKGPAGYEQVATAGPRMPVEARFSPDGEVLYVVDFGALAPLPASAGPAVRPFPGTGVLWRVIPDGAEVRGPPPNQSVLTARSRR